MTSFYWTTDVKEAEAEQRTLKELLKLETCLPASLSFKQGLAIGSSYDNHTKTCFAVGVLFDDTGAYSANKRGITVRTEVDFPYIPGLLAFRVGPAICALLDTIADQVDFLLIDGQGVAHQRGFGLASHIGVLYNKVSIGITRNNLFGNFSPPPTGRFNSTPVTHPRTHRTIGYALSLGEECQPCYVSPGHNITCQDALSLACQVAGDGVCFPRPLNRAHAIANSAAKKFYESRRS